MTSSKLPTRYILRGILRHLKQQQQSIEPSSSASSTTSSSTATSNTAIRPTQSFVLNKFRSSSSSSQKQQQQKEEKLAKDYYMLKKDLAERERLQKIDTGAEVQLSPKEMSRRAAARAGLQLPEEVPSPP